MMRIIFDDFLEEKIREMEKRREWLFFRGLLIELKDILGWRLLEEGKDFFVVSFGEDLKSLVDDVIKK